MLEMSYLLFSYSGFYSQTVEVVAQNTKLIIGVREYFKF